ncbi:hypothetical protein MASR2M15_19480 [Anaerolineales bacterium]
MYSKPRTLAFVGMPGAGKSMCADYLADCGFFRFRFGSIIVNEVIQRGWPVNPNNERTVREEFRAQDGMDAIARRALPLLLSGMQEHETIVIDGLYSWSEYRFLRKELGTDMQLIAVVADRMVRYERLSHRTIRPLTHHEAEERDWTEIEMLEKGGPIAIADFTLLNNGAIEDTLIEMKRILSSIHINLET